jgi:hypothetical protein
MHYEERCIVCSVQKATRWPDRVSPRMRYNRFWFCGLQCLSCGTGCLSHTTTGHVPRRAWCSFVAGATVRFDVSPSTKSGIVWGRGDNNRSIVVLGCMWDMSVQLHAPANLQLGKEPQWTLNRLFVWSRQQTHGCAGNLLCRTENETCVRLTYKLVGRYSSLHCFWPLT